MNDFNFIQNPITKKWVILAPRRAKRPDIAKGIEPPCPFCPAREGNEKEVYRVPLNAESQISNIKYPINTNDQDSNIGNLKLDIGNSDWKVRVIPNKYPFAPNHEVIIHSPDHHKSFGELPLEQVSLILQTYRHRYNEHAHKGQVYIFHNHAKGGGESLPHPHTQLVVIPENVQMDIPPLESGLASVIPAQAGIQPGSPIEVGDDVIETRHFTIFCPATSAWPDEVWIAPKVHGRVFGEITDNEIVDLGNVMSKIIHILDLRHGQEFPFNFYIYPGGDWYMRLIPRDKGLGGFEVGTNVFVNTQDPQETIAFIQEHFNEPNIEKIKSEHQADYSKHV